MNRSGGSGGEHFRHVASPGPVLPSRFRPEHWRYNCYQRFQITMARKNVIGRCRLCRRKKPLCRSHYYGAALQRLCQLDGKAVVMTPKLVIETQRQVWAHLLCLECEGRLNKCGETPVLRLLDTGKSFSLLDRMDLVPRFLAVEVGAETITYSGASMGIDTDALAHFALGLLWKAAVYKWRTVAGQTASISLPGFKEKIRKYLLGTTPLPAGIAVIVAACDDYGSRGMVFPPARFRGQPHRHFSILTRGIWFDVIVDDRAAERHRHLCCVRSDRKVLIRTNCHQRLMHAGKRIYKTAKIAPSLAR
jgi:hypothetical protein